MPTRDFFEDQDRYGNRMGQGPTKDPASGNPRPMSALADFVVPKSVDYTQGDPAANRGARTKALSSVRDFLNYPLLEPGALAPNRSAVDQNTANAVESRVQPSFTTRDGTGIYASGSNRPDGAGRPNEFANVPEASGGGGGGVTTLPQNVNPFLSKYAMSEERRDAVNARDFQLRREGNAHLATDATDAERAKHEAFLTQKAEAAQRLERSELERQLGNVNVSGNQSIGSMVGNRRKARQLEDRIAAFDDRKKAAADRSAEAATAAADRTADFVIEQFKAQQEARQPKVGATLERIRGKLAAGGFDALSPEERFMVTEDIRTEAVETLEAERAFQGTDKDGNPPPPITAEQIEDRVRKIIGTPERGTPYSGTAPPASHPAAQQGPDGLWYVPAQAGEPGARKLKDGNYVKAVTQ